MNGPEGFAPFPSLYADSEQVGRFSEWETPILVERAAEYGDFLRQPDLMPRARETATRIMGHLCFELAWRDGFYDKTDTEAVQTVSSRK